MLVFLSFQSVILSQFRERERERTTKGLRCSGPLARSPAEGIRFFARRRLRLSESFLVLYVGGCGGWDRCDVIATDMISDFV